MPKTDPDADFDGYLAACRTRCQAVLLPSLDAGHGELRVPAGLLDASRYPFENTGKLVRPVLCYAAAEAVAGDIPPGADHLAAALEIIHTYSLIHDDLPAMDDDDLRRGRPSLHRAFDEATAILVGDGLQARAFELLARAPDISENSRVAAISTLAGAAGLAGMVGGQFVDISAVGETMDLEALREMHLCKTGALIRASVALGGIAAGATEQQLARLDAYGRDIGLAFQVVDDILDVTGDTQTLGKTQGKDALADKPTYVTLLGLDGARAEARQLMESGLAQLAPFAANARRLEQLARYIVHRDR